MTDKAFDEVTSLRLRLEEMRLEHRDLDDAIVSLAASPTGDELMLRRLKKRKLALKDRIIAIEHMLSPDERARRQPGSSRAAQTPAHGGCAPAPSPTRHSIP